MNDDELRQVHAAIESLKLPTNKRASIEQMVADGKVEWTAPNEWRLTEKGLRWLGRIGRNASNDSRRSYGERTQDASSETRHRLSRQRDTPCDDFPIEPSPGVRMSVVYGVVV